MNKMFKLFSLFCTMFVAQQLPLAAAGCDAACAEQPREEVVGPCYCLCARYIPQYYNTYRTECEPKVVMDKCTRLVPKYYEKQCTRMVPQNYTETCCKYESECYEVPRTTYVSKQVCEKQVRYVPQYFYKCTKTDGAGQQASYESAAPSGCPTGGCPARG